MKNIKLILAIFTIAAMIVSCTKEGSEGPQGPQGPPGKQGEQGSQGPSGVPGMTSMHIFVAEGSFGNGNSGRTRVKTVPNSQFPAVDETEDFVVGYIYQYPRADPGTSNFSRVYLPMPFTYYSSSSDSEGWYYYYGITGAGHLQLYIKRTDNSVMNWDTNNMTTGWNYRFFVFKNEMTPMELSNWEYDEVEDFAAKNPEAVVYMTDEVEIQNSVK